MRTIHIHQAEIIEFEERESNYIAAIESQTIEAGLQTYIILMDPEEEVKLVIGSILTKEYDISEAHNYAMNMLADQDYCDSVWAHNKKIN